MIPPSDYARINLVWLLTGHAQLTTIQTHANDGTHEKMKEYTIDELRRKSALVLNDVMMDGGVKITHRDRPEMSLVLSDHLKHLQEQAAKNGAK